MQVLLGKYCGFCAGVRKAVDKALAVPPQNTFILGELIHNPDVVERIRARGIPTVERVEEVPDGAIYYSSFDKELSSETFGDGGQWPYLDQFDGWINHKGSGVARVTYDYQSMSVRSNQSSKGSLSLYDGSGQNNIFFSTAPN